MQITKLLRNIHSDFTGGSDGPSCFEVLTLSFLKPTMMPTLGLCLVLCRIDHTHLKWAARGSSCASSHRCSKASDGLGSSTIWGLWLGSLGKVGLLRIFSWSLARVNGAILREGSNQVVWFDQRTLASLRFWFWRFGTIFGRNLRSDAMRSSHSDSVLVLNGSCWSTSLRNSRLLIRCLLLALLSHLWGIHYLVIPNQCLRLRSNTWSFRRISQHNISRLYHLWHSTCYPWLISPTKCLRHRMLVELVLFFIISPSEHAIAFVDDLVRFQLFLNIWKSRGIEFSLWSARLVFAAILRVKGDALLQLGLQLLRWWILLALAEVDELDYLVGCGCKLVCVDCVVNVCDVLGAWQTCLWLRLSLRLRLGGWVLLVRRGWFLVWGLLILIELLTHDLCWS